MMFLSITYLNKITCYLLSDLDTFLTNFLLSYLGNFKVIFAQQRPFVIRVHL